MSRATPNEELLETVAFRYDGSDNEGVRLLEQVQARLAWRLRHSGKTCDRCDEDKPLADFSRDSREPDGLRRYCRKCAKESYARRRVNA